MWAIKLAKSASKELDKAPKAIHEAFDAWASLVLASGPAALREVNGYWDHALKGEWAGARACSLNKNWRVIYYAESESVTVLVVRISSHDYRR